MIIIIMRGENFVAHRCAAEHRLRITGLDGYSYTSGRYVTEEINTHRQRRKGYANIMGEARWPKIKCDNEI
jgi:hypothetical protein